MDDLDTAPAPDPHDDGAPQTITCEIAWEGETPPSNNEAGFSGGRNARQKMTRITNEWKAKLGLAYMADSGAEWPAFSVPAPLEHVQVDVTLRFDSKRTRDPENYRTVILKAVGDWLAPHDPEAARLVPNDKPEHFLARNLNIIVDKVSVPATIVRLTGTLPSAPAAE